MLLRATVFAFVYLFTAPCWSETLFGQVVGVTDGDTVTVLDASRAQHKVRLGGIDAPEKKQAYGEVSKQHLARLLFGKQVTVEWSKRHRKRLVGTVLVDGTDAGLRQIEDGFAWHFKRYEKEQTATDRYAYARAEEEARLAKRGLWRDPRAIPPWEFRKQQRAPLVQAY